MSEYVRKTDRPYGFLTWGKVLRYIDDHLREKHFPPTYREIADAMDVRSTSTVANHVEKLIARGLISRVDNSPRTMVVTEKGKELLAPKKVEDESTR